MCVQDTVRIPLLARDNVTVLAHAIVDATDAEWLNQWTWRLLRAPHTNYAVRSEGKVHIYMHRVVLGLPVARRPIVDHRDRNGLNNTRVNLRKTTNAHNTQNRTPYEGKSSEFRGVSWKPASSRWRAQVKTGNRNIHLGHFEDELDAAGMALTGRLEYLPGALD